MSDEYLTQLAEPFPIDDIHWRVGSTNRKAFENGNATKRKGMPLAYLDARNVMNRLDEAVGPGNWRNSYQETGKRLLCKIEIRMYVDGEMEWIGKTDGAGDTQMEGEKGGISSALKRSAVLWGIGRYLYDSKMPWIELDDYWNLPKGFDGSLYLSAFGSKQMRTKVWKALKKAAATDDAGLARETWDELTTEQQESVWRDLESYQRSTIKTLLNETTGTG